jgi:hypothetical protein
MRYRLLPIVAVLVLVGPASATEDPLHERGSQTAQPETPWKGKNLKYFPKDISRDRLTQRMREFSFALGVRCQYCHAGGNGITFDGVDFSSDEKAPKRKARAMLRMLDQVNKKLLPDVPSRAEPRGRLCDLPPWLALAQDAADHAAGDCEQGRSGGGGGALP